MNKDIVIEAAKLNQLKYVFDESVNDVKNSELKQIGVGNFIDGAKWMKEQIMKDAITDDIVEKQGTTIKKTEHKFSKGDIISNGEVVYRVDDIVKNCVGKDCYFLVNIKREKDGMRYIKLFDSEGNPHNSGEITWLCEQVDVSFQKQGKHKPANVEPFDEYEGLTDFERTLTDICVGWIGMEIGWKEYIKDNADALLKIAIDKACKWLEKNADKYIVNTTPSYPDADFSATVGGMCWVDLKKATL